MGASWRLGAHTIGALTLAGLIPDSPSSPAAAATGRILSTHPGLAPPAAWCAYWGVMAPRGSHHRGSHLGETRLRLIPVIVARDRGDGSHPLFSSWTGTASSLVRLWGVMAPRGSLHRGSHLGGHHRGPQSSRRATPTILIPDWRRPCPRLSADMGALMMTRGQLHSLLLKPGTCSLPGDVQVTSPIGHWRMIGLALLLSAARPSRQEGELRSPCAQEAEPAVAGRVDLAAPSLH
jgi:hypothetical protein